ncbi:hypothetical protein NEUTE2DRAFT_66562 [Neurospora tetrasperma FGSC 2509]|nr:hypothetical protein NEUTE2DRAFT_66562 [Neurospora tetrasperma FGSC 2509]
MAPLLCFPIRPESKSGSRSKSVAARITKLGGGEESPCKCWAREHRAVGLAINPCLIWSRTTGREGQTDEEAT